MSRTLDVLVNVSQVEAATVAAFKQACLAVLKDKNIVSHTVAVALVDEQEMRQLNRTYHQIDAPTDVLSFPYLDPQSQVSDEPFISPVEEWEHLGDIAICLPVAVAQAKERNVEVVDQLAFLFDHGIEHLLGHHHE